MADALEQLRQHCSTFRVTFTFRNEDGEYYLDFDGTKAFSSPEDWHYFFEFERYVEHVLRSNGFTDFTVRPTSIATAEAYLGSLFSFLIREKK